jgi:penicillin-binding protein 2
VIYRFYTLQIMRGEELTSRGRRNFVQKVEIPHDRGIIYDRYGQILVDNRPSIDVQVIPAFLGKGQNMVNTLARLFDLVGLENEARETLMTLIKSRVGLNIFKPIVVKRDLDPQQIEAIEAERSIFRLDGVDIIEGRKRTYPYGVLAAHLLGYVNEIDAAALNQEKAQGNPLQYEQGDVIGREGMERSYEMELRGVDGYQQIVVDAKGRRVRDTYIESLQGFLGKVDPQPGHNVFLSIDLELQKSAEEAFNAEAGAVVVVDARTGAILAMVSKPSYNPNLVSGSLAKEVKQKLDEDPLTPWIDRAIYGQYAPGSTFKVATALAALRRHTHPKDAVFCPGRFNLGKHVWRCWNDRGHGSVDLKNALKASCDVYFYTVGNRLGLDLIAEGARMLGLGSRTGIPLRGEKPGLIPDEAFHNRVDASSGGYQKGMAINSSIGQGSVLVTPLQLARAYAAVATGNVWVPQLVDRIETADFRVTKRMLPEVQGVLQSGVLEEVKGTPPAILSSVQPRVLHKVDAPIKDLDFIREGLAAVMNEPGGTGYSKRSLKIRIAGKTGTAQTTHLGTSRVKEEAMDYFARSHAWFAAYAPVQDPEIAVAVLYEHGGHGGTVSAPIAVAIIESYFELKERRLAQASKQALEAVP